MAGSSRSFVFSCLMVTERVRSTAFFGRRSTRCSLKHSFAAAHCFPYSYSCFYLLEHQIEVSRQRAADPRFLVEMTPTFGRTARLHVSQQPSMVAPTVWQNSLKHTCG